MIAQHLAYAKGCAILGAQNTKIRAHGESNLVDTRQNIPILAAFIITIYHILGINMKLSLLLHCILIFDVGNNI